MRYTVTDIVSPSFDFLQDGGWGAVNRYSCYDERFIHCLPFSLRRHDWHGEGLG